tara:strand:- start:587 stop:688 length:102 start_codon:yes stop_codon:yes gene_type:complete
MLCVVGFLDALMIVVAAQGEAQETFYIKSMLHL